MIPYRQLVTLARLVRARETFNKLHCINSRNIHNVSVLKLLPRLARLTSPLSNNGCICCTQSTHRVQCRNMAGHAHWRNVKHIKEAADSKYSLKVTGFTNRLRSAVKGTVCMVSGHFVTANYIQIYMMNV